MKRWILYIGMGMLLGPLCSMPGMAQDQPIPPPPKVRKASKELYPLHPLFVQAKVLAVDTNVPVRYEVGGREYRRWGYPARLQILEVVSSVQVDSGLDVVIPGYTIRKGSGGPRRWESWEESHHFTRVTPGATEYLALDSHTNGYWLVKKVLNRHDFAEMKKIGERVELTGRDDTIGVKGSSFRLHMNPLQKAYYAAANQVREGEMTQEELEQQFTPEMIQEVYDPNNAELVLGRK